MFVGTGVERKDWRMTQVAVVLAFTFLFGLTHSRDARHPVEKILEPRASTACDHRADGVCKNLITKTCPIGWNWEYSGCGFLEKCCYPTQQRVTPAPTIETTASPHHQTTLTCGNPSVTEDGRIVGGVMTSIEANPWQVSFRLDGYHICGGSLISDKWVLTAAHCVKIDGLYSTSQISVLVGTDDRSDYSITNVHGVDHALSHSKWDDKDSFYDVALVKLSKPVDLTDRRTRSICLPTKGEKFNNEVCVASGWGLQAENDNYSPYHLRRVTLPILSESLCYYYMGYVHDSQICAGRAAGGADTCQGDSGGPLVCKQSDGSWVQAGIVSNGVGCARSYKFGFYTEVADFLDWIDYVMDKYGR